MTVAALNQLLVIYMWFPLGLLILFLLLIARFYQKFSNHKTYARFFLIPFALFGVACVRYATLRTQLTDPFADSLMGIGGFLLAFLFFRLYWLMMIKHRV